MAEGNPNLSPCVTHQPSLLGGAENIKLLFDEEIDNRRESLARQRAWEAISLDLAQTASRRAQNAATIAGDSLRLNGHFDRCGNGGVASKPSCIGQLRVGYADRDVQHCGRSTLYCLH